MAYGPDHFQAIFVAELLQAEAHDLAGSATRLLLQQRPDIAHRYRPQPQLKWRPALHGRIHELAAAIAAQQPELFSAQVGWSKAVFSARQVPVEDLTESLRVLDEVLVPRLPPEDRALVRTYLLRAMRDLESAPTVPPEVLSRTPHSRLIAEYLVALLEGERARACRIIRDAFRAGIGLRELYTQVLTPAMRELGRLWQLNEITVAEEHFATATTVTAMSQLLADIPARPRNGRTLLAASVEGNTHDLGVRMVSDLFELEGWKVIYLGPSVPAPDLQLAVKDFGADLVALSAAMPTQLQAMADAVTAVRAAEVDRPPKILVGGCPTSGVCETRERLGADACAEDLEEALALGTSLVFEGGGDAAG